MMPPVSLQAAPPEASQPDANETTSYYSVFLRHRIITACCSTDHPSHISGLSCMPPARHHFLCVPSPPHPCSPFTSIMVLTLHGTRTTALPVLVAARFQGVGIALNESTPVVDSQGNATVVLETKHGDIRSVGACLRYVANLSAASAFGGLTAFHRAQIDQWIGWAFNELLPRRLASAIASKREMLQSLVNMGIRGSCIQLSLRARAKTLLEDLKGLNELLLSRSFLVGDAITAADVAAVASLNDPVNFFLTAAERAAVPNVMRWFNTVRGQPEFVTVAGPTTIAGPREGGMIDLRPRPEEVAALAEASVALNAGFKKKQSQRQKEKAQRKAENSQPGAGAGAGAGAAAAEVALVAATAEQPATNMTDKDLTVDQRITKVETKLQELSIDFKTIKHAAAHTVRGATAHGGFVAVVLATPTYVLHVVLVPRWMICWPRWTVCLARTCFSRYDPSSQGGCSHVMWRSLPSRPPTRDMHVVARPRSRARTVIRCCGLSSRSTTRHRR